MPVMVAATGLLHQDMRDGRATVPANRCEYRQCWNARYRCWRSHLPSLRWQQKMLICVGWAIHAAFTVFVAVNRDMAGVFLALLADQTNTGS
jgi:hypothetical protein